MMIKHRNHMTGLRFINDALQSACCGFRGSGDVVGIGLRGVNAADQIKRINNDKMKRHNQKP
ncbi:Uncharacterised protein [Vibrio cholerae]|nr:Uncharacterised protein [Vibrio cholerae]CSB93286.1 Uncharacterised protein [Vibrio cholerae]CSC78277.1 Uncharacterised protein [Vibrio cholerae]CSD37070.1 Uncharacterised protein [Vibrio cholerae]